MNKIYKYDRAFYYEGSDKKKFQPQTLTTSRYMTLQESRYFLIKMAIHYCVQDIVKIKHLIFIH